MFSNRMRVTGFSGMDTHGMVEQIMRAESVRHTNLMRRATLTQWRMASFRGVSNNIGAFQTGFLSIGNNPNSIRMQGNFRATGANIVGENTHNVRVSANASAQRGRHNFRVESLAQTARVTGTQPVTANGTTLGGGLEGAEDIDFASLIHFTHDEDGNVTGAIMSGLVFNVTQNTITRQVAINGADLIELLGLTAELDDDGNPTNRINLDYNEIEYGERTYRWRPNIEADWVFFTRDSDGDPTGFWRYNDDGDRVDMANPPSGFPTNPAESPAMFYSRPRNFTPGNEPGAAELGAISDRINDQLRAGFGMASPGVQRVEASFDGNRFVINNNNMQGGVVTIAGPAPSMRAIGTESGQSTRLDTSQTMGDLFGVSAPTYFMLNGEQIEVDYDTTLQEFMNLINNNPNTGVNLTFNQNMGWFVMEQRNVGEYHQILTGASADGIALLNSLGFTSAAFADGRQGQDSVVYHRNPGSDTETRISIQSNTFIIDGVTVTLEPGMTIPAGGVNFQVDVARDTDAAMDLVRNFVNGFNEMIDDINTQLRTSRPRGANGELFEPLSDEERRGMSDNEIARWEEQAMTGLLHRDPLLSRFMREMRHQLMEPIYIEGVGRTALSHIGITFGNPLTPDGHLLQIDEARLMAALERDPDMVMRMFTQDRDANGDLIQDIERLGIGHRLENAVFAAINTSMGTGVAGGGGYITRHAGSDRHFHFGNVSVLQRQLDRQNQSLARVLESLERRENQLFMMFSRMEMAMIQAEQQMSQLFSMLGQNA